METIKRFIRCFKSAWRTAIQVQHSPYVGVLAAWDDTWSGDTSSAGDVVIERRRGQFSIAHTKDGTSHILVSKSNTTKGPWELGPRVLSSEPNGIICDFENWKRAN
jgi:hypothetical protein